MKQPILLWKPLGEIPKDEPEMQITYGDQAYAVPYTLLYNLIGWIRLGGSGTTAIDGPSNTVLALETILQKMRLEHYPVDPDVLEQYRAQGIRVDTPTLPPVRDYRPDKPFTAEELRETSTMRRFI